MVAFPFLPALAGSREREEGMFEDERVVFETKLGGRNTIAKSDFLLNSVEREKMRRVYIPE